MFIADLLQLGHEFVTQAYPSDDDREKPASGDQSGHRAHVFPLNLGKLPERKQFGKKALLLHVQMGAPSLLQHMRRAIKSEVSSPTIQAQDQLPSANILPS